MMLLKRPCVATATVFKKRLKKATAAISIALTALQGPFPATFGGGGVKEAWADANGIELAAVRKQDVGADDNIGEFVVRKSNVLFVLTGDYFNMSGVAPAVSVVGDWYIKNNEDAADWDATRSRYKLEFEDIVELTKSTTFGNGMLPSVAAKNVKKNNNYGRELDESNNYKGSAGSIEKDMEKYKQSYYFPFTGRSNPLKDAFSAQKTEYLSDLSKPTENSPMYTSLPANTAFPYALVFKNPKYWASGWTESTPPTSADLVPNDSSMYMMKLVMWRVFSDEKLFRNIRFGMAGRSETHTWINHGYDPNGKGSQPAGISGVRVPPYGAGTESTKLKDENGNPKVWTTGIISIGSTGEASNKGGTDQHGAFHAHDPGVTTDPLRYADRIAKYKANLYVPIADTDTEWRHNGRTISHADRAKMWVNGLLDMRNNGIENVADYWKPKPIGDRINFYRDPELVLGSINNRGIYPPPGDAFYSHESYTKGKLIWYAHGSEDRGFAAKNIKEYSLTDNSTSRLFLKGGSGEATGSLIDFFSPPVFDQDFEEYSSKGYDDARLHVPAVPSADMADVSFPIKDECENNWVILLHSGNEARQYKGNGSFNENAYYVWTAIKNLYDHTDKDNDGSKGQKVPHVKSTIMSYENGVRKLKQTALENPVRTLVVGMVGDPKKATTTYAKEQMEQRIENLTFMARAGQGDDPYDEKSSYKPLFAYDVDSLMRQIEEALRVVAMSQEQPQKGKLIETPSLGDEDDDPDLNLFGASYVVRANDQWEAKFYRYSAHKGKDGKMTLTHKWDLADTLELRRGFRNFAYWSGGAFKTLEPGGVGPESDFARLTGLTEERTDPGNIGAGLPSLSQALYAWLQGLDSSYTEAKGGKKSTFNRPSMLTDFGQSGIAYVGAPSTTSEFPDPSYKKWAEAADTRVKTEPPMIYAQTNDGIMHVVNPKSGVEKMAILPPPMLLPLRLAALKTVPTQNGGKLSWLDVKAGEDGKDETFASNPLFLLDGPVQARNINLKAETGDPKLADWKTYLLSTLGRGGNGLYMMDVTDHDAPAFKWYMEIADSGKTGKKSIITMTGAQNEPDVISEDFMTPEQKEFLKLGFNSPKPAMGAAALPGGSGAYRNFIALPGGTQNPVSPDHNGKAGAALFLLDPMDGRPIRVFGGLDLAGPEKSALRAGGGVEGKAPYMGMMVSEPTLVRSESSAHMTGQILAADNRGNIFRVWMENASGNPLSPAEWRIETAATLQRSADIEASPASYALSGGMAVEIENAEEGHGMWVAGGTADLRVPVSGGDGAIGNEEQMIFAFRMSRSQNKTQIRDVDWKELTASSDIKDDPKLTLGSEPGKSGWYVPLEPASGQNWMPEYVTAGPVLDDGILYVGTFLGKKIDIGSDTAGLCDAGTMTGYSRLYAIDLKTGGARLWSDGAKYISLESVKITGLTLSARGRRKNLLVTYSDLPGGDETKKNISEKIVEKITAMNVISVTLGDVNNASMPPESTVILYWLIK